MSLYLGTNLLSGVATNTIENAHSLLDYKWTDHILNELSWLRADTFSWQSGTVYTGAYNHILADYNGGTSTTETIGSYTITYVLADDGHKITTDETTVANIYAESGVAWYYILDTVNTRFKLPRENPAREELIQTVRAKGNGMTLGLTDGTNNAGFWTSGNGTSMNNTNAYGAAVGSGISSATSTMNNMKIGITPDSTKSGIISSMTDSTSVYKGHKYLYFYVGNFSQSATEQTAGLNASLFNGKMDLDLTNIDNTNNVASTALNTAGIRTVIETYQNGTDWYRIYSDGWCEQGGKTGIFATSLQTFTLLKQYKDTNYSVVFGTYHNQGATSTWNASDNKMPIISVQYVGSFNAWCRFEGKCGAFWEASGYIS